RFYRETPAADGMRAHAIEHKRLAADLRRTEQHSAVETDDQRLDSVVTADAAERRVLHLLRPVPTELRTDDTFDFAFDVDRCGDRDEPGRRAAARDEMLSERTGAMHIAEYRALETGLEPALLRDTGAFEHAVGRRDELPIGIGDADPQIL